MKADLYSRWWEPWGENGLAFDGVKVSISLDSVELTIGADYRVLVLAEPDAILPKVDAHVLEHGYAFDRIYTFNESILEKYETAELFLWGSSWLDVDDLDLSEKSRVTFVTSSKRMAPGHELRLA